MRTLIKQLHEGHYSCVILSRDGIKTFTNPGVADLLYLLNHESQTLKGALVADKVVGKAAAALLILGMVAEVYAEAISTPALEFLNDHQVPVTFMEEIPFVMNRQKDGWCPMERLAFDEYSPQIIKGKIEEFINNKP